MKSQNIELTRKNNPLEAERLKSIKKLRQNEAQMGESGIIFLGLRVLGRKDADHNNNSSGVAVMRQVLEDTQNQSFFMRTDIFLIRA